MRKNQVAVLITKGKPIISAQRSVGMNSKNLPKVFSSDGRRNSPKSIEPSGIVFRGLFVLATLHEVSKSPYRLFSVFHLFREPKSLKEFYAPVGGIEEKKYDGRKEEFLIKPNRPRQVCFDC